MSIKIVLLYLVIQFIVQYIFYKPFRDMLFKIHSKYIKTIPWIKIEFFFINLCVSLIVLLFTGRGGATGMTNTFASVLLGIIMAYDYYAYKKSIFNKSYYKKQEEIKNKRLRIKQEIERLDKELAELNKNLI